MYHIKFFSVQPEKRGEVAEIMKGFSDIQAKGVEPVGLFYPRGSGYMYATVTKYENYGAWEKYWRSPEVSKVRQKGTSIITCEMDMFFDEIKLE